MSISLRYTYLLTILLFLSSSLFAHEDHYYNSLLGPDMVVGSSVNVQESLYLFEDGDLYDVVGSYGLVKLRYDYEADEVFFSGGSWPLVVVCAVIWYDRYGVMHKESISLEIDPGSGEINDLIRIEGAHRLHATLKSISGGPGSGLPSHVFLEGEIHTERYFTIDGPQPGLYNVELSLTDQSLAEISWSHIFGAEFYELEWVVIDDADGDIAAAPGSYTADFSEASRLQIRETDYSLSLAYPKSAIAYRLRPVYRYDRSDPGGTGSYYTAPGRQIP